MLLGNVSFWIVGCSFGDKPPASWQTIDAGTFSLFAPAGWRLQKLQGFDSHVGEFIGDGMALNFDFGRWSNSLDETQESYVIAYQVVGGLRAKLVSSRTPGRGLTGIYFRDVDLEDSLCLYGNDLGEKQQQMALRIFRTIRFKDSGQPYR